MIKPLTEGDSVLNHRYTLEQLIRRTEEHELWRAVDVYGANVFIKAWPYRVDTNTDRQQPNDVRRAIWDIELRNLLRLSSAPEAEDRLLTLRDARVDTETNRFIMVFPAQDLEPLDALLKERSKHGWLRDLSNKLVRARLWQGVYNLAQGLHHIHEQQILHRSISPVAIFVDTSKGPEGMLLGGFEGSVRLGTQSVRTPPLGTSLLAPELAEAPSARSTYSFETDWFYFGALLAVLFAAADANTDGSQEYIRDAVIRQVQGSAHLFPLEKEVVLRLLSASPRSRLARGIDVIAQINEIVAILSEPVQVNDDAFLALVVSIGPGQPLTRAIIDADENISATSIMPQVEFIQRDLEDAEVAFRPGAHQPYLLIGNKLDYVLEEYQDRNSGQNQKGQWKIAATKNVDTLKVGRAEYQKRLRHPIKVYGFQEMRSGGKVARDRSVSWKAYLPQQGSSETAKDNLQRLHEFFRVTNQLDLLLLDAQIFAYEIVPGMYRQPEAAGKDGVEQVTIKEIDRDPAPMDFTERREMSDFLRRLVAEKEGDETLVYLGPDSRLILRDNQDANEDEGGSLPKSVAWEIDEITQQGYVRLKRVISPLNNPPPERGYLRSWGMPGQVKLIIRRNRAIERLKNHNYLLRALLSPDYHYIDTAEKPPLQIPDSIDEAKSSALMKIWRTRPIFALQGPPGTGKTTLVAHLLGQILQDDPVAQVLVTAQAHAAVDVLREKVNQEAFVGKSEDDLPLFIRLAKPRRTEDTGEYEKDSKEYVTKQMLERARDTVRKQSEARAQDEAFDDVRQCWLKTLDEMVSSLALKRPNAGAGDMFELSSPVH